MIKDWKLHNICMSMRVLCDKTRDIKRETEHLNRRINALRRASEIMIKPKNRIRKIRTIEAIKREAMPATPHEYIPISICAFCRQRPGIHSTCFNRLVNKAKGFAQ